MAGFVFVRYFAGRRRRGWAAYCVAGAVVVLVSFLVSFGSSAATSGFLASHGGLVERIAGVVMMAWLLAPCPAPAGAVA